jgi:sirohydrochlorin cobaltochelatase
VEKIVVIPVFLAHGIHTTQDIPRILGLNNANESQHQNHGDHDDHHHSHGIEESIIFEGEIIYTKPLGADSRIAEIIKDRVNDAL